MGATACAGATGSAARSASLLRAHDVAASSTTHEVVVKTRHVRPYGTILTTSSGRSLYLYSRDSKGKSRCNGSCASIWHPLIVPRGDKVVGVRGLDTITRRDGKRQAALRGKALYVYSGDAGPGDVSGQGEEGKWYVATPHGASHASASPSPSPSSSSPLPGGYGY
jgi:predicted lipoprotein with Yx(FWY)xxD motif